MWPLDTSQQFKEVEAILASVVSHIDELDRKYEEVKNILRELTTAIKKIIEILKSMDKKIDKNTSILQEHSKILQEHSKILKEHSKILKEHSERLDTLTKDVRDIKITIRRLVYDIEEEALEVSSLFLERILGFRITLKKFEIPNTIEINIYGEHEDIIIIGECKNRIRISSIIEVLEKAIKYTKHQPEKTEKSFILLLYGLDYIQPAKEIAENIGIAIITPRGITTTPKKLNIKEIKQHHKNILNKIKE